MKPEMKFESNFCLTSKGGEWKITSLGEGAAKRDMGDPESI